MLLRVVNLTPIMLSVNFFASASPFYHTYPPSCLDWSPNLEDFVKINLENCVNPINFFYNGDLQYFFLSNQCAQPFNGGYVK